MNLIVNYKVNDLKIAFSIVFFPARDFFLKKSESGSGAVQNEN